VAEPRIEDLFRELTPQVLGILVRRFGRFELCEDALQEAFIDAARQWPVEGVPANPRGWLITVASRRVADALRSDVARQRREVRTSVEADGAMSSFADVSDAEGADDTLTLLFLCCHPGLTPASQIALTLRAVGGLTTAEIARAFLVPEATMAQRISRAKGSIRSAGAKFSMPPPHERAERLRAVLHVLYLIFNEGHTATSGHELARVELTTEAIRLTRDLRTILPDAAEVAGLLALMLLLEARRPARTDGTGELVPLAEQDRSRWNKTLMAEGLSLLTAILQDGEIGPYQLQAAIAAVHGEAATASATDWPQILALYDLLEAVAPGPIVRLNRAVAVAMVDGPDVGLAILADVETEALLTESHRVDAVRAHLHEMRGNRMAAIHAYRAAASRTASEPERRYLERRAMRLENA
jgi:RNA polymerase sigma factor (sigma-70 family)